MNVDSNDDRGTNIFLFTMILAIAGLFGMGIILIFFPEHKSLARTVLNYFGGLMALLVVGLIVAAMIKSYIDSKNRGIIKISLPSEEIIYEPGQTLDVKIGFEVPNPQRINKVSAELVCYGRRSTSGVPSETARHIKRTVYYRSHVDLASGFDVNPSRPWNIDFKIQIPEKVDKADKETNGLAVNLGDAFSSLNGSIAGKALSAANPELSSAINDRHSAELFPGLEKRAKVEKEIKDGVPIIRTISAAEQMKGDIRWAIEVMIEPQNAPIASSDFRLRIVEPENQKIL